LIEDLLASSLGLNQLLDDLQSLTLLVVPVEPATAPRETWVLRTIPVLPADPDLEQGVRLFDASFAEQLPHLRL